MGGGVGDRGAIRDRVGAKVKLAAALSPFGEILMDATIPTSFVAKVQLIHRMVRTLEANGCIRGDDRYVAEIALDEALNNAIQHGNRGDPRKTIRALLFADGCRWGAIIEDEGEGFRADAVPDPKREENLLRPCGRGIALMEEYLDELWYNERGNAVMLVKKRS